MKSRVKPLGSPLVLLKSPRATLYCPFYMVFRFDATPSRVTGAKLSSIWPMETWPIAYGLLATAVFIAQKGSDHFGILPF